MPNVNQPTIREQVLHMLRPSVWGTHLEVKAAATLFQFPIFFCTQPTQGSPFCWSAVQPVSSDNIRLPLIIDDDLQERAENITHIEMYHHQGHYDAIVSVETGKMCRLMPQLTGRDDPGIVDLT